MAEPDTGKRGDGTKRSGGPANVFSLFDNEEAVLDRTEVMLTQLAAVADGVKVLAEAYRRGYREQRRLVRLSDRMQADLQKANKRLAEQQRDLQNLNEALSGEIETSARLEAELRRLADTDPLTGALARRRFLEVCARDWPRRPGQRACLLMLDLDRFKLVNDSHGHAAGDAALIAFVAACRSALRSLDAVGRLGGEEFAVLLVETDPADGAAIAERIRAAVAANPSPPRAGRSASRSASGWHRPSRGRACRRRCAGPTPRSTRPSTAAATGWRRRPPGGRAGGEHSGEERTGDPRLSGEPLAEAAPRRGGSLRGAGPMRRGDAPADLGVTGVPTTQDGGADTMRPGALRGAARGRNLDGLAHTLFLRLSPVIAAVVLATQVVIAWVNYGDQIRIEGERARTMADMTARALAHPGWTTAYGPPLQALGLDPAFRSAILRDAAGGVVARLGEEPRGRSFERIQVSAEIEPGPDAQPAGSLTLVLSAEGLRANAEKQVVMVLGASLVLILAFALSLRLAVGRHVLAPLRRLLAAMGRVERKEWVTVDLAGSRRPSREIADISAAFNRMVEGLRSGDEARHLLAELERAHARLAEANGLVMESLNYARRIQQAVLPGPGSLRGPGSRSRCCGSRCTSSAATITGSRRSTASASWWWPIAPATACPAPS